MARAFRPKWRLPFWCAGLALCAVTLLFPAFGKAAGTLVRDPATGCATSNPYPEGPEGSESISWNGACQGGLLSGYGTLVWYRSGVETERNEGMFWSGEMHGPASTIYPDGTRILGTYNTGQRNGQFMTYRPDGGHAVAEFQDGRLIAEYVGAAPQSIVRPAMTRQPDAPLRAAARAFEPDPIFETIIISSKGVTASLPAPVERPYKVAYAGWSDSPVYTAPYSPAPASGPAAVSAPVYHNALTPGAAAQSLRTAAMTPPTQHATIQSPEQRFVAALSAERAGRANEAANVYSDLVAQYPHTDSARLAAERLAMLPAAIPPAVIDPEPISPGKSAAMNGKFVCTLPGLYGRGSKWCGVVRNAVDGYMSVEVKRVNANGFFNIGFTRAPCTGNTFITKLSRGIRVTVPQNCMGPSW